MKNVWEEVAIKGKVVQVREKSVYIALDGENAFWYPKKLVKEGEVLKIVGCPTMMITIYGKDAITWEAFKREYGAIPVQAAKKPEPTNFKEVFTAPSEAEWNVMNRLDVDIDTLRARRKAGLNDDGTEKAADKPLSEEDAIKMRERMFKDMQKGA
jgi:hypothetical protein